MTLIVDNFLKCSLNILTTLLCVAPASNIALNVGGENIRGFGEADWLDIFHRLRESEEGDVVPLYAVSIRLMLNEVFHFPFIAGVISLIYTNMHPD